MSIPLTTSDSSSSSSAAQIPLNYTHPRTPSFDGTINSTPIFSSPDTPYDPGPRGSRLNRRKSSTDMEVSVESPEEEDGDRTIRHIGLSLEKETPDASSDREMVIESKIEVVQEQDKGEGSSRMRISPKRKADELDNEDDNSVDSPDPDLDAYRRRLDQLNGQRDGDGWSQRDELVGIVRDLLSSSLEKLPLLKRQVDAQSYTIRQMQNQAKVSQTLMQVERDRHTAERAGWRAELKALDKIRVDEIAAGTRPNKSLQIDVGYHQELEAANKRLEMDNRLMAPRLADTQKQIDKLVTELRYLRSHVILSTEPISRDIPSTSKSGALQHASLVDSGKLASPTKLAIGHTTMGDARAEHLLLAAKKVRAMRAKDDCVGRLTLNELQKGGVVGPNGGLGYAEGYGETIDEEEGEEEEEDFSEDDEIKPVFGVRRDSVSRPKSKVTGTPLLPRAKRSSKRSLPPPSTPRGKSNRPQTTPGGSNFDELLRAAEMATRPGTPTPPSAVLPLHGATMSATRSTTRGRADSVSDRGSPVKRVRRDAPPTWVRDHRLNGMDQMIPERTEVGAEDESALDILAQASQLEVAQSQDSDSVIERESLGGGLAPAINLQERAAAIDKVPVEATAEALPTVTTPKARPRALSNASEIWTPHRGSRTFDETPMTMRQSPPSSVSRMEDPPYGAYASPTGAAVPGLGKYVHLTSSLPARRVRSPYLKWTVEEDELLARAVAIHGEKWDLVSKGVPTRSYHQVRQRWLRRTGAFDKKPQVKEEVDDDEEGSPTPTPGGFISQTPIGKKRKASVN